MSLRRRRIRVLALALALVPGVALAAARLDDVGVRQDQKEVTVHLKVSGRPSYHVQLLGSPPRIVIDLADTTYAWPGHRVAVGPIPIAQIRGSQVRPGVARVVVELLRFAPYGVREEPGEIVVVFPSTTTHEPPTIGPAPETPPAEAPAPSPASAEGPRRISLDFKDADVVNLIRILAAESGKNIVMSDDVKGKMSIALRNVPWEQALDTILEAKGLEKIDRDGVIRIVSIEQLLKEREAKARAGEAKRKAELEIRAKEAEAHTKEIEARAKQQEAQRKRQQAEDEAKDIAARGPLMEATIRLFYADAEEVAKTLQGLLGIAAEDAARRRDVATGPPVIPEPPFSALFGPQPAPPPPAPVPPEVFEKRLTIRAYKPTNTLFLRLYQSDIERIRTLIRESIDIPVPQVKIEARMEILDRSALEQIGVQWGGFVARNAGSQTLVGQGFNAADLSRGGTPVQGVNPPNSGLTLAQGLPISALTGLPLGGNIVNLPIGTLPTQGPLPTAGIAFGIVGTNLNVNLALQALAERGKTRTLARPEIVTVENHLASIELGEEIPYTTVSAAGTQIQFKKAALKLEVTPTVVMEDQDRKIRMVVIVENNSRGDLVNLGSAGTPPAINTRKATTQVLVKEGERLVIGGIARTEVRDNVRKVPVLGDIPILGALFRISESFEQGRELVVFLTPSVLRQPGPKPPPR